MKKIILIILTLMAGYIGFNLSQNNSPKEAMRDVKAAVNKIGMAHPEQAAKVVSNAHDLIKKVNVKYLDKTLKETKITKEQVMAAGIKNLKYKSKCIQEGSCLDNKTGTRSGFIDKSLDGAFIDVNNALEMFEQLADEDLGNISDDLLLDISILGNKQARITATNLILRKGSEASYIKLARQAKKFRGEEAADFIAIASSEDLVVKPHLKAIKNDLIRTYLKSNDKRTQREVLQKLVRLPNSREEVQRVMDYTCPTLNNPHSSAEKIIKLNLELLARNHEIEMDC